MVYVIVRMKESYVPTASTPKISMVVELDSTDRPIGIAPWVRNSAAPSKGFRSSTRASAIRLLELVDT